ncbi:MAG TPA: hypothetical protein VIM38_01080 [Alphaproteobacteria bacterium]
MRICVCSGTGIYPPELRSTNLDFDWFYRRLGRALAERGGRAADAAWGSLMHGTSRAVRALVSGVRRYHGPDSVLARTWPTGSMAFWTTIMPAAYLVLS